MATVPLLDVGVVFVIVVTATLANGFLMNRDAAESRDVGSLRQDAPAAPGAVHRRGKRCTCYTYKDKECVYYCHLDIIWINTPEHTVPYGMSSYQGSARSRRSAAFGNRTGSGAQRCVCWASSDTHCTGFCTSRQGGPPGGDDSPDSPTIQRHRENQSGWRDSSGEAK